MSRPIPSCHKVTSANTFSRIAAVLIYTSKTFPAVADVIVATSVESIGDTTGDNTVGPVHLPSTLYELAYVTTVTTVPFGPTKPA